MDIDMVLLSDRNSNKPSEVAVKLKSEMKQAREDLENACSPIAAEITGKEENLSDNSFYITACEEPNNVSSDGSVCNKVGGQGNPLNLDFGCSDSPSKNTRNTRQNKVNLNLLNSDLQDLHGTIDTLVSDNSVSEKEKSFTSQNGSSLDLLPHKSQDTFTSDGNLSSSPSKVFILGKESSFSKESDSSLNSELDSQTLNVECMKHADLSQLKTDDSDCSDILELDKCNKVQSEQPSVIRVLQSVNMEIKTTKDTNDDINLHEAVDNGSVSIKMTDSETNAIDRDVIFLAGDGIGEVEEFKADVQSMTLNSDIRTITSDVERNIAINIKGDPPPSKSTPADDQNSDSDQEMGNNFKRSVLTIPKFRHMFNKGTKYNKTDVPESVLQDQLNLLKRKLCTIIESDEDEENKAIKEIICMKEEKTQKLQQIMEEMQRVKTKYQL